MYGGQRDLAKELQWDKKLQENGRGLSQALIDATLDMTEQNRSRAALTKWCERTPRCNERELVALLRIGSEQRFSANEASKRLGLAIMDLIIRLGLFEKFKGHMATCFDLFDSMLLAVGAQVFAIKRWIKTQPNL
eukprot:11166248-Lingulodinium_polyedra.AAC.1